MAVGADRNLGQGPVPADTADEPAQMAAHLLARRRLARAQQHRHRSADRGVLDMDRHWAQGQAPWALNTQLLMTVNDIGGVVDIERHRRGWGLIAGHDDTALAPASLRLSSWKQTS